MQTRLSKALGAVYRVLFKCRLFAKKRGVPFRCLPPGLTLPVLQTKMKGLRWIVGSGPYSYWLGTFEYEKRLIFERTVKKGSIVFDVGAHAGFYTLLASALTGQAGMVYAFEPLPKNALYLREHLRLNRVTNVVVVEAAVADTAGTAPFQESRNSTMGQLCSQGSLQVRTVVLDELCLQGGLPLPAHIKIDVEGGEMAVLAGARSVLRTAHPTIFLSAHDACLREQCRRFLRSMGYLLQTIKDTNGQASEEILACYPGRDRGGRPPNGPRHCRPTRNTRSSESLDWQVGTLRDRSHRQHRVGTGRGRSLATAAPSRRGLKVQRKRVLVIGHTYAAPLNRRKFEHMAKDQRFEFLLVTPRRWRNLITSAHNPGGSSNGQYSTAFVDVWLAGCPALYVIPQLGGIIRKFRPQLIYCEQEPICFVSSQAALLAGRTPTVYFSWENVDRRDIPYRAFSPLRALCFHRSSLMAAGSWGASSVIRSRGYKKPVHITPILGVAEELFFPRDMSALRARLTGSRFVIGFVGRFVEQKDVATLLKAVARLRPELDWHLVLVGGGPQKTRYEELGRRLGIPDRLTVRAAVPHHEVPQFLNCFDVLVLPSRTTPTWKEQFGHVLIEAMACGVPTVGSSSGEIPNVIAEAGLIFQEGDAADLSEKLRALYCDPALRDGLRERGLRRVRERYTDTRIAQNMIALCEIALDTDRTTPNTLEVDQVI